MLFVPVACLLAQTPGAAPAKPSASKPASRPAQAKPAKTINTPSNTQEALQTAPASGTSTATPATPAQAGTPATPATPAAMPSGDQVVMTIGDTKITADQWNSFVEALPANMRAAANGPNKRALAEQWAQVRLMAQEARRRNLDQTPAYQQAKQFAEDNLLARTLYENNMKTANVDEAELRKAYDTTKQQFEQASGKHILIRFQGSQVPIRAGQKDLTEQEALAKAQEVRKRLLAGEDFATVAKAESDDVGSGAQGGSLGTFRRGQMVGPFDQAAFSVPVKQVSEPIRTDFGYHLIYIDSRDARSFEQVRSELEGQLRPAMVNKAIDDMRKSASVTYDESFFGPALPQAPQPGMMAPPAPKPAPRPQQ